MEKSADDFERGLLLFNAGRFFECHEVWEIAWKRSTGDEKTLLQALIQCAVVLLHLERRNLRGARSVWAKANARFATLPANVTNLDLEKFRAETEAAIVAEGAVAVPRLLPRKSA